MVAPLVVIIAALIVAALILCIRQDGENQGGG